MSNLTDQKTYGLFQTTGSKKLISQLENKSAKYFLFPPIETEKILLDKEKIEIVKNIVGFDWLIFTDVYAVDYFLEALTENDVDFFELDNVRVCTFGEAVADRLRFVQIHADVIPVENEAVEIFSSINFYVGGNTLANLKMLLIKKESENFKVSNLLDEAKAEIIELPIYKASISDNSEITKLKTLLKGGAIDEFVFSSPEDLIGLRIFFSGENELEKIFQEVAAAAVDANTFQNLRENNFKPHYLTVK